MPHDSASLTPAALLRLLVEHRKLLLAPAIAGTVLAALGAIVSPRDWQAEQGLLIRSDAAGYADQRLGKFTDLSEMKTVQETLLELARSQSVVTAVLQQVTNKSPSAQDIEDFRADLRLTPPGGAEFGKTEVFYVGVLDPNRDRAIAKVEAVTKELDQRLNELRNRRASSMVAEVERSVAVARGLLHEHVQRLTRFEQSVGSDLIELRHLTNPSGGQSELSQQVIAIEADRRRSAEQRQQNEVLLVELQAAAADPSRILVTPDTLLVGQPALRRLKNGLVDAQLTVARTAGARTANHPYVLAARRAQEAVQDELVRELPAAIAGVQLELQVAEQRESAYATQLKRLRTQSAGLAGKRSQYAELVAHVESQSRVLESSLQQLADAKAHRAGASTASLLSAIDDVETGAHPVGPGRSTVTAAGGLAGLLFGGVLVFVFHAPRQPTRTTESPRPLGPSPEASVASPWAVEATRPPATPAAGPTPFAGEFGAIATDQLVGAS